MSPEEMMLDKAQLLDLTPAEMTVLVGGLRSLGISANGDGVWSDGNSLNNQWFKTLLDMGVAWKETGYNSYAAYDRVSGDKVRTASRTDLVFGSNSELRAIAEVYAHCRLWPASESRHAHEGRSCGATCHGAPPRLASDRCSDRAGRTPTRSD